MEKPAFEPRKFLFVSHQGLIHDLAWEVKKERHDVRYHIQSKADKDVADGLVDKVDNWEEHKSWADGSVFGETGGGDSAEKLRREGKAVVGGTRASDRLE